MGKIRVQDPAKMMGISNQDLVLKRKSIGARVEGDDAQSDTDIIQAILQGKKLPHPREVILRDEQSPGAGGPDRRRTAAAPPPPMAARRPLANPLGSRRPRTLIQKVEPRIQTLPMSERPAPVAVEAPAMAEALPETAGETVQPEIAASAADGVATAVPVEAPPAHVTEIQAPPPPAPAPAPHQMREAPPPPPSRPAAGPSPAVARPAPSGGGRPGGPPAGRSDGRPPTGPGGRPGPGRPARPGGPRRPRPHPGLQQAQP